MPQLVGDVTVLTDAYEALRAQVLGEPFAGRPAFGLAVLYRRGLAIWLTQLLSLAPPAAEAPSRSTGRHTSVELPGADRGRAELVLALASLLAHARGGAHVPAR